MFTSSDLEKIIDSFADIGLVFSNEQDFQFQLGKELKKLSFVKEVYFEMLSLKNSYLYIQQELMKDPKYKLTRDVKEYYDLIVELDDGTYVAIELKYKTPQKICFYETKFGKFITLSQGAYDLGAYDFLEDISRLEKINTRYFPNGIKISKGYCIFLTNDKNYRFNDFSGSKIWKNYSLRTDKLRGELPIGSTEIPYLKRYEPLILENDYPLSKYWHDYKLTKKDSKCFYNDYEDTSKSSSPGFSFLLVEIMYK